LAVGLDYVGDVAAGDVDRINLGRYSARAVMLRR